MRFFFPLFLFTTLFACSDGWLTCKQKALDAKVFQNNRMEIPLKPNQRLIYSEQEDPSFERYDPLLGLGLIRDPKPFAYPYALIHHSGSKPLAAVNQQGVHVTKRVTKQCGLRHLGRFERSDAKVAMINDSCCALHALMTPRGAIDASVIEYFSSDSWAGYGDAGVRFAEADKGIIVISADPFFETQTLQVGDLMVTFDGQKPRSLCVLEQAVLLSIPGSTHRFEVLRQGVKRVLSVTFGRRMGGGLRPDTYLERAGITLDRRHCITSVDDSMKSTGLQQGDCWVQINRHDIADGSALQTFWKEGDNALLFERRGLQFFIHIKSKDAKMRKKI
ncbi:MAG: PDZ domain-containing protein [Campylobacterales bacterium]|nr:PDZ domain-containing protein [Campylobacterales bacterium]